ncbi:MAG: ATP-dependent nuclease [Oscillospiraceae bacterium]
MNIRKITEISNYRNMSGCSISFDKSLNYIIGENNIGKTNLLELLNSIFSVGKFIETDFFNVMEPIMIVFTLEYDDASVGFFEDNFDVDDNHSITLVAEQEVVDGRISYYHNTPNMTPISFSIIKKINTLYYYAQRMPSKEVNFKKTNGSGKILNYLIKKSLQAAGMNESDVINRGNIEGIISNINNSIDSINTITGDSIRAYLDPVMDKIVSRLLMLGDENGRELSSLGEGIQYAFNIILQIIEIIHNTKISRRPEQFEERLICDGDKKYFPLILLLDEPEIHQHPYRQRNLTKKIEGLMCNTNQDFLDLLRELFDIDGLNGQIFITTHSPNILLNDYKQFIRLYKDFETNDLVIVSGSDIDLDDKLYKHLLHNYLYLKEAMFSKRIVFVEGDTESGAVPVFAKRKNFDLDEHGIGIIKLDGADSILYCMELYRRFGIKTYAIIDRDKKDKYEDEQDVFFTTEMDYEEDVYASFKLHEYLECCKELDILPSMIGPIKRIVPEIDVAAFRNDTNILELSDDDAMSLMNECKESQLEKLKGSKNACKGAILAQYVTEIPTAFNDLIDMLSGGHDNGH